MVTISNFKKIALNFPESVEEPHFELTSFRFKKKIFATLNVKKNLVCIMLRPNDQSTFCTFNNKIIYPVPNKWGSKGATYFELTKLPKSIIEDALKLAYQKIATKSK